MTSQPYLLSDGARHARTRTFAKSDAFLRSALQQPQTYIYAVMTEALYCLTLLFRPVGLYNAEKRPFDKIGQPPNTGQGSMHSIRGFYCIQLFTEELFGQHR